ncbi:rhamnan synthesis F family protein [Roseomonas elaeocarpi]|uniref:Rhamnan synthesis F family protein n=1 Tax=Roseomonas elaeocarpi TaxID=907779 RepID=A0ABV6JTN3_9PROT
MQNWEQELGLGDEISWDPMRIVPPDPWVGHLPFAFWLVKALRPTNLVELGTHSGNSYFGFCQAMAALVPGGRAYAVDTWQGDPHAGMYGEDVYADVAAFNAEHFRQFSTLMRMTFDEARAYFPDAGATGSAGIDLLHIDGLHSYEAVEHDFETWRTALSSRGVVIFHDTNVREREFGVWRLWKDLSARFPSFEFNHSNGLGVLGVGPDQAPALRALFALEGEAAASFRRRISARGEVFQRQVQVLNLREQLRNAEAHAQNLTQQIAAATHNAEAARTEIAWRDTLLGTKEQVLASKDAMLAELGNLTAASAAALAARDQVINARDLLAMQLTADMRHHRHEHGVAIRKLEDERDAANRNAEAVHRDAEAAKRATENHLRNVHAEAQAALASVQAQAAAIMQVYVNSTSWRLTRPLRVATRLLRRQGLTPPGMGIAMPALTPPPAALAALPAPAAEAEAQAPTTPEVTATTPLKAAMRGLLQARLDAFLAGSGDLHLPRAAQPDVSIILVLYNQAELTFGCLASIIETLSGEGPSVEVVIIDNGSTDQTGALLDRLQGATVVRNGSNLHFLKAVNLAAKSVRGRHILLLNNDAQLLPGAVASAVRTLESADDIGAVGGRIILPDGTLQEAGSIVWQDGACSGYGRGEDPNAPDFMFQRDVDYCSGAFLLTPAKLWREMGGFDERYAPAYYEETDYCLRLWEGGHRVVFDPEVAILHYEFGSSSGSSEALALQATNHRIFRERHKEWLAGQFPNSPLNTIAARTARSDAPRILVFEDRVPKVELGTGYPRANRFLHELVAAGAQVALFPMHRHPETWHGVRRALDKRIEVLIAADGTQVRPYLEARRGHFDAIIVCRPPNMDTFEQAIGHHRDLIGDARVIYDAEALFVTRNLQHKEAEGQPAGALERHQMVAREVALTRLADAVISVAPAEQATLEDYGAREVTVLGHALDDQPISTGYAERDQIVFLGAIQEDSAPNADAVLWFAREILPNIRTELGANFRLTVVGQNKSPAVKALDGEALDLVGMVPELPPALARARVLVVPTRFAAGIPHKVHQAAMLGIPMVVTGLIAQQLGWQDGREVLVADTAPDFAAACLRLFNDQALWEAVRRAALDKVRQECAPEVFTRTVERIVDAIPVVRRRPEPPKDAKRVEKPVLPAPATEPNTSRPAELDFSAAVPFGFAPLDGPAPRIGVMCHLFHTAIGREVLYYLRNLPNGADLMISTDTEEKRREIEATFNNWTGGTVEVRVTPNRGRDIAPKLVGFADRYGDYDLVLHLHSKVSTHAHFLEPWRSFLFENLLGSPAVVRSILDAFARLPELGMVAPQHYESIRRWLGWNGNFEAGKALAARMGVTLSPTRALDFPSGSMFWARPAALKPLLDLKLRFEDFPEEGAQLDHTPAHAIERLYFIACERSGHSWIKVAQPVLMRDSSTVVNLPTPTALAQFMAEHGVALTGVATLPHRDSPAPMMTRIPPGLVQRLAGRQI